MRAPAGSQRHFCEHAFVTSQGSLQGQFARACERGNYLVALALARELAPLSVGNALSLLLLIAKHDPERFDAAAVRWHGRFCLLFSRATRRARRHEASRLETGCDLPAESVGRALAFASCRLAAATET